MFHRRLRCHQCGNAVEEQGFSGDQLMLAPERRRCLGCMHPPQGAWPGDAHMSHYDGEAAFHPIIEPAGEFMEPPFTGPHFGPPPEISDEVFTKQVVSLRGWLRICREKLDPNPRIVHTVTPYACVHPDGWLPGHPAAVISLQPVHYGSGHEVVLRHVLPFLQRANRIGVPQQLKDSVEYFVDRYAPAVTHGVARIERERGAFEVREALFFECGWQVWSLERRETNDTVRRHQPLRWI